MSDNSNDDVASQVQSKINEFLQSIEAIKELNENTREMFKNDPNFSLDSKYNVLYKTDIVFFSAKSFFSEQENIIATRDSFNQNSIDTYLRTVLEGLVTLSTIMERLKTVYAQIIATESVTKEFRKCLKNNLSNMKVALKILSDKYEKLNVPVRSNVPVQPTNFEKIVAVTNINVKSRFDEYQKVAKYTPVASPEYKEIFDGIKEIVENYYKADINSGLAKIRSYASIVGPSFMGKTQLAFALARAFKVFYVNFSRQDEHHEIQKVYQAFENMSGMFMKRLNNDCAMLNNMGKKLDSSLLAHDSLDVELNTVGFLWYLLDYSMKYDPSKSDWFEYYLKPRNFQCKPMSINQYLTKLSNI